MKLHAPSRRELLLASGTLFAWTYWPKLACAEGRDPRFLTIILRGALDGLATVAPVGDPDWLSLRGDNALTLDSKYRPSSLMASSRLIQRCQTCTACSRLKKPLSCTLARPRTASAPISMVKICWRADCQKSLQATAVGSIVRWPA